MSRPLTVTTKEAAEMLGITPGSLLDRIRVLQDQHGFPHFVPGLHRRYDRQAIVDWLARQRSTALAAPHVATSGGGRGAKLPPGQVEAWQSLLDQRAAPLPPDQVEAWQSLLDQRASRRAH